MDRLADLTVEIARHYLTAIDVKRIAVANRALDICCRLVEDALDRRLRTSRRVDQLSATFEISEFAVRGPTSRWAAPAST